MTEILNHSLKTKPEPPVRFEYRFEEIETTALDTVFNYLFDLLTNEDS